ncbi:MAG: C69 family dipeptidase [Pilosibacter sp.]
MNGIAFQDAGETWWLETIGGHHWIAKHVPDDRYGDAEPVRYR